MKVWFKNPCIDKKRLQEFGVNVSYRTLHAKTYPDFLKLIIVHYLLVDH